MKNLFFLFLAAVLFSCAPSRFVKPLEKGQKAVAFNLGGPLIGFAGTTIPVPLSSVTGGFGMKEDLTVFGSLHTTSLLYRVIQAEAGALKELMIQKGRIPAISVAPVLNIAGGFDGGFKVWPELDVNAYWNYRQKKNFFYLGASNWFELSNKRAQGEAQQHFWLLNPHAGHTFVRNKWNYTLEAKWLVPNIDKLPNVVDYKGPGSTGAIGIYFSVTKKF